MFSMYGVGVPEIVLMILMFVIPVLIGLGLIYLIVRVIKKAWTKP
jgi:hypothetical protein